MKPLLFAALTALLLLLSCHRNSATSKTAAVSDTIALGKTVTVAGADAEDDIYANVDEDSLLNNEVQKLLINDKNHVMHMPFSDSIEITASVIGRIQTHIKAGMLFDGSNRFALIKQVSGNGLAITVYKRQDGSYKQMMEFSISEMEYSGHTLKDVNSDGYNDLLIDTYGCCGTNLKGFCEVYLYKPDGSGFTEPLRLDNPTFFPDERVVRGITAGQLGESPLYKMAWDGTVLKPGESISLHPKKKHRYILEREGQKPVEIKEVPAEYKSLKEFYWFMGEMHE